MKYQHRLNKVLICLSLLLLLIFTGEKLNACTIGIIHGSGTKDGRAIQFKVRDTDHAKQYLMFHAGNAGSNRYIGIGSVGNIALGLNECGVTAWNSWSRVPDDETNTIYRNIGMTQHILSSYTNLTEIKSFVLEYTNSIHDTDYTNRVSGNFAFSDALGNTALYELAATNADGASVGCAEFQLPNPARGVLSNMVFRTGMFHYVGVATPPLPLGTDDLTSYVHRRYETTRTNLVGLMEAQTNLSVGSLLHGNHPDADAVEIVGLEMGEFVANAPYHPGAVAYFEPVTLSATGDYVKIYVDLKLDGNPLSVVDKGFRFILAHSKDRLYKDSQDDVRLNGYMAVHNPGNGNYGFRHRTTNVVENPITSIDSSVWTNLVNSTSDVVLTNGSSCEAYFRVQRLSDTEILLRLKIGDFASRTFTSTIISGEDLTYDTVGIKWDASYGNVTFTNIVVSAKSNGTWGGADFLGDKTRWFMINHLNENTRPIEGEDNHYQVVRYGGGRAKKLIARDDSVCTMIVQGVKPGESPALSTAWAMLGNPNYAIAVPAWVSIGERIHNSLGSGAAYDRAYSLYTNGVNPVVVQKSTFPVEQHMIEMMDEVILPHWRSLDPADISALEMARVHWQMADDVSSMYRSLESLTNTSQTANRAPVLEAIQTVAQEGDRSVDFSINATDNEGSCSYDWNFGEYILADSVFDLADWCTTPGTDTVIANVSSINGVQTMFLRKHDTLSPGAIRYFCETNEPPISLEKDGDKIRVSMRVAYSNTNNLTNSLAFRIALANSGTNRVSSASEVVTLPEGGFMLAYNPVTGTVSFRSRDRSENEKLHTTGAWAFEDDKFGFGQLDSGILYDFTFEVERTAGGNLLSCEVSDGKTNRTVFTHAITNAVDIVNSFDTLVIGKLRALSTLHIQDVRITQGSSVSNPAHAYRGSGQHLASCTVTDDKEVSITGWKLVEVHDEAILRDDFSRDLDDKELPYTAEWIADDVSRNAANQMDMSTDHPRAIAYFCETSESPVSLVRENDRISAKATFQTGVLAIDNDSSDYGFRFVLAESGTSRASTSVNENVQVNGYMVRYNPRLDNKKYQFFYRTNSTSQALISSAGWNGFGSEPFTTVSLDSNTSYEATFEVERANDSVMLRFTLEGGGESQTVTHSTANSASTFTDFDTVAIRWLGAYGPICVDEIEVAASIDTNGLAEEILMDDFSQLFATDQLPESAPWVINDDVVQNITDNKMSLTNTLLPTALAYFAASNAPCSLLRENDRIWVKATIDPVTVAATGLKRALRLILAESGISRVTNSDYSVTVNGYMATYNPDTSKCEFFYRDCSTNKSITALVGGHRLAELDFTNSISSTVMNEATFEVERIEGGVILRFSLGEKNGPGQTVAYTNMNSAKMFTDFDTVAIRWNSENYGPIEVDEIDVLASIHSYGIICSWEGGGGAGGTSMMSAPAEQVLIGQDFSGFQGGKRAADEVLSASQGYLLNQQDLQRPFRLIRIGINPNQKAFVQWLSDGPVRGTVTVLCKTSIRGDGWKEVDGNIVHEQGINTWTSTSASAGNGSMFFQVFVTD